MASFRRESRRMREQTDEHRTQTNINVCAFLGE